MSPARKILQEIIREAQFQALQWRNNSLSPEQIQVKKDEYLKSIKSNNADGDPALTDIIINTTKLTWDSPSENLDNTSLEKNFSQEEPQEIVNS